MGDDAIQIESAESKPKAVPVSLQASVLVKKIGRNINKNDKKAKTIMFLSDVESLMIFKSPNDYIQFLNHTYETNDVEEIEFLRTHNSLEKDYWEGKYPDEIIERMKRRTEMVTKDEELYEASTSNY